MDATWCVEGAAVGALRAGDGHAGAAAAKEDAHTVGSPHAVVGAGLARAQENNLVFD